jgi:hypothetical protein
MPDRQRLWAWGLAFAVSVTALVQVRGALERAEAARRRAELGESALQGGDPRLASLSDPEARGVLMRLLQRGDYASVRSVAAARPDDPVAPVFAAAALAEQGDEASARRALAALSPEVAGWGPGRTLQDALARRAAGASVLVRDASGRLRGAVTSGALQLDDPQDAAWIPRAVLADPRLAGGTPSVRLTLDADLGRLALQSLGAHRGSIVLLDPASGALLAAVTDPRTLAAEGGTPSYEQRREPASILKLVTTSAAFAAGLDPNAEIAAMTCNGHERYRSGELWCSYPAGHLSGLDQALAISCNVAFASLGSKVGRAGVLSALRRFGFDRTDVPWAGHVLQPEGDALQLANLSVGLTVTDVTPLHAALIAAAMANGGAMPEPTLLAARDGLLGLSPRPIPPGAARPVLDARFVPVVQRAMMAVTRPPGTASELDTTSFPIAMKTGTASQTGVGYHVNYVGFGPPERPAVAFCVRVTHEGNSQQVNRAARDVMAALLEGLGRRFRPRS